MKQKPSLPSNVCAAIKNDDAPLFKERKAYLQKRLKTGISPSTMVVEARLLLKIVANLKIDNSRRESIKIDDLIAAIGKIKARSGRPLSQASQYTILTLSVKWLASIELLDQTLVNHELVCDLYPNLRGRIDFVSAPAAQERLEYLLQLRARGFKKDTLQVASITLSRLVSELDISSSPSVAVCEIEKAIKSAWKKACSTLSPERARYRYAHWAIEWVAWMGKLKLEEQDYPMKNEIEQFETWMSKMRDYSASTIYHRRAEAIRFAKYLHDHRMDIAEISPKDVDRYISFRKEDARLSRSSTAELICCLRAIFKFAEQKGWCDNTIRLSIQAPRVYQLAEIPSFMPWDDVQKMLARSAVLTSPSGIRNHAILTMFATYGIRNSELRDLTLDDLDWKKELIYLHRAKNGRAQTFPLNQVAGDAVIRYIKQVRQNNSGCRNVFLCMRAPYRPMTIGSIYALVAAAVKYQGVSIRHFGPHCLRHGCATHLINSGFSMKEVADVLGHRKMKSTCVYAKVDFSALREVSDMDFGGVL